MSGFGQGLQRMYVCSNSIVYPIWARKSHGDPPELECLPMCTVHAACSAQAWGARV